MPLASLKLAGNLAAHCKASAKQNTSMQGRFTLAIILVAFIQMAVSDRNRRECHPYCGRTPDSGECRQGRCLCMWGMTGPFSRYIKRGKKKGRVEAQFCEWGCDYSKDEQNAKCVDNEFEGEDSDSGSDSEEEECEDYDIMW